MCGFVGYINLEGNLANISLIREMTQIQNHRGPDDNGLALFSLKHGSYKSVSADENGTFNDFTGAVGFNRLSILDLSANGHQPMYHKELNIFIVFNGEIYNAFNYKKELLSKGYLFHSKTDTEILLYLYKEYGIDGLLGRLNGMFSFFLVDLNSGVSYLARDHFGIKPMYYYSDRSNFMFSSEIKSFLVHPGFKAEMEEKYLGEFILFRYTAHERTLYKNVKQLPPGYYLEISTTKIVLKKYWEPDLSETQINENDALDQLDHLLKESVKSQLLSDVKVGCQLSGGIDSSLVTTYAREFFNANMDTFSIVFADQSFSEEHWINQVVNKTLSDSHRYIFETDYLINNLFQSTWHLDQPINLPNTLAIKKLAERSRENVTVLLSGEGADELMGGYSRFFDLMFRVNNDKFLRLLARTPYLGSKVNSKYKLDKSKEEFIVLNNAVVSNRQFSNILPSYDIDLIVQDRINLIPEKGSILKRTIIYELRTHLIDLLNRQDKMTMAHSMENRVPFLDRNLVSFILSLPDKHLVSETGKLWKYNQPNLHTKHLLKKLAEQKYGKAFAYRSKSGFPLPLKEYFNHHELKSIMEEIILPGIKSRGLLQTDYIKTLWKKENKSNPDLKLLWMFLSFEIWAQIFIDGKWQK
jgi:asparagine synthase (glutamine-hydrolysing)